MQVEEVIFPMASSPRAHTQVFLCYDLKDQARKDELMEQLAYAQRHWSIDVWSDERIPAGKEIKSEIATALATARVAVLLVSAGFLASELITEYELPTLLRAAEMEGVRLLPILLSPCLYQQTELAGLQYINPLAQRNKGKQIWTPLSRMSKNRRAELWVKVVEEIQHELSGAEQVRADQVHESNLTTGEQEKQRQEDQTFAKEYCAALCSDPLLTKIQVLDMDHALALEDIYVRVRIRHENRFRYPIESVEQSGQDPLNILNMQQKYLEERERAGMKPVRALRKHPHCVIVGDPGVGKTTLLKYLALQCARGKLGKLADCALFVSLHDFARKSRADHNLVEYILEEWGRVYHLPKGRASGFLERQMRAGRVLILLDALDETMVGSESAQAEQTYQIVHEAVSDLHRCYPHTPMVVTARKAAYHQHAHLVGFDLLETVDFLPKQIKAFVKNWFQHDPKEERRSMGEGLLTRLQNNPRISTLAANPLLLGLIAYTYEENNERLPVNRADLYKLCIETLLRKWDDKRKIRRAHPVIDTYEQERLLPRLAWNFHTQGLRYFTGRELLAHIRAFVEALGRSAHEEHLQDILNEITSDNGLLREQAPGYYGFLHLTLQEYFTARHLTNIGGLELLLEHLGHPWWEEVVLLYAGLADDASDLLDRLLSHGTHGEAPEDIFCSKLLLAGHCLAAQVQIIRNKQLRTEIPNLLLEKLHGPFTLLQQQAAEVLAEIGRAYPEHEVNDRLFAIVADKEADEKRRTIVLDGISIAGSRRLQRQLLPFVWQSDLNVQDAWSFRLKIIAILGQFTDKSIQQEAKTKLSHKNLPSEVLECIVILLCRCPDTATLEWLLEWLEKEQDTILSARAFSTLNTHKREDISVVIQYISRFFKQRLPDLRSGYGYGVQLLAQVPSLENRMLLESIVFDKTLHRDERKYALKALIRMNGQTSDKILSQLLIDPNEEEILRETTVQWLTGPNQLDQKEMLLFMLRSEEMPLAIRLTIAARLANRYAQEITPVLWEFFQRQKTEPITRENVYFCIQPLILLLEQNEEKALQEIIELLENVDNDIWTIFPGRDGKKAIYLPIPNGKYYTTFSKRIAAQLVDQADPLTLSTFCFNHQIQFLVRRDLIRQIAQMGKKASAYISMFLEELADCTGIEDIRVALAETLGELVMDEQTIAALLNLYQEESYPQVKDALYTALSQVTRRANVTIVPNGSNGGLLRLVRR
jgi:NACHT domain/TIR domain